MESIQNYGGRIYPNIFYKIDLSNFNSFPKNWCKTDRPYLPTQTTALIATMESSHAISKSAKIVTNDRR